INSVTITGPAGRSARLNLNVSLNLYALTPVFMWVAKPKVLGTKFAAFVMPAFANTSIAGSVSAAFGAGLHPKTGQFNVGDTFVEPIWLGWTGKKYDIAYGYGFYIPTGQYHVVSADVRSEERRVGKEW